MKSKIVLVILLSVLLLFAWYYFLNEGDEGTSSQNEFVNEVSEYDENVLVFGIYKHSKKELYEDYLKEILPEETSYAVVGIIPGKNDNYFSKNVPLGIVSKEEIDFIKKRIDDYGVDILLDFPHNILCTLSREDYLADIESYVDFPDTYLSFLKEECISGNYIISKWSLKNVLYYNKSVIDKYSLKLPSSVTMSEIKNVSDALYNVVNLDETGGKILSLGNTTDELSNMIETFIRLYYYEDFVSSPDSRNKEKLISIMNEYFELINKYSYEYDAMITVPSDWVFAQEKFLLKIGSNFELDVFLNKDFEVNFENVKIDDSFELGVAPVVTSKNSTVINFTASAVIANNSLNEMKNGKENAKGFMSYLSSKEFSDKHLFETDSLFSMGSSNLPVNYDEEIEDKWSQVYMDNILEEFISIDNYDLYTIDQKYIKLKNRYTSYISDVITGSKEINQVFGYLSDYTDIDDYMDEYTDEQVHTNDTDCEDEFTNIGYFFSNEELIFKDFSSDVRHFYFPGIKHNKNSRATFDQEIEQISLWIQEQDIHVLFNVDVQYIPELKNRGIIKDVPDLLKLEDNNGMKELFIHNYYQSGIIPLYLNPKVITLNKSIVKNITPYMTLQEFNDFIEINNLTGKLQTIPPFDADWGNMYYGNNLFNYLYSIDNNSDDFNTVFNWYIDFLNNNSYANDEAILDESVRFINQEFYAIEASYGRLSDFTSASRPNVPSYYRDISFEIDIIFYPYMQENYYNQFNGEVSSHIAVVSHENCSHTKKIVGDFLSKKYFEFNYVKNKYYGIPTVLYEENDSYFNNEINDANIRSKLVDYLKKSNIPSNYYNKRNDFFSYLFLLHGLVKEALE